MPKETHGGGDDGSPPPEDKKKPQLQKYGLTPDLNIRDLFWRIMVSYATTKKPGLELDSIEAERIPLMRAALSVLSTPSSEYFGLSQRFVGAFTVMMFLDAGWDDAFAGFMIEGYEGKPGLRKHISASMKKVADSEGYKERLREKLAAMLRKHDTTASVLECLAEMKDAAMIAEMKKELIILARGDIGSNQINAIHCIALLKEDEEVKKSLLILLTHWDAEARMAAAGILKGMKDDPLVRSEARKRALSESDPEIKSILERMSS